MIQIVDIFWTFQGEGFNSGRRALFVRLPFCNLSCNWCDTEFNTFKTYTKEEFEAICTEEPARFAVITGGEPTMSKNFAPVYDLLKLHGFEIAVESNGTFPPPSGDYWLTVSPKREQKIHVPYFVHPETFNRVNEFKYVVDDVFDFEVLKRHKDGHLYLSPEFNNLEKNLNSIFDYIKETPKWKISLQTHKWMNIK